MAIGFDLALLIPDGLAVHYLNDDEDTLVVTTCGKAVTASCPLCVAVSRRIQSGYVRQPSNFSCTYHRVRERLLVRWFRCVMPSCQRPIAGS